GFAVAVGAGFGGAGGGHFRLLHMPIWLSQKKHPGIGRSTSWPQSNVCRAPLAASTRRRCACCSLVSGSALTFAPAGVRTKSRILARSLIHFSTSSEVSLPLAWRRSRRACSAAMLYAGTVSRKRRIWSGVAVFAISDAPVWWLITTVCQTGHRLSTPVATFLWVRNTQCHHCAAAMRDTAVVRNPRAQRLEEPMRAAKAVVAAVGTVVTALTAALADDVLSLDEVGQLVSVAVVAAVTVWGVWRVPNADE